jgi:signal transduction histidine kinase
VRVAATFAAGGLLLSATLAVLTYALSDRYLTGQRERSAERQAFLYARVIRDDLRGGSEPDAALAALEIPVGSGVLLHVDGVWSTTARELTPSDATSALRGEVRSGRAVHQRVDLDGSPALIVGVPVPEVEAEVFVTFQFRELARTLGVLRNILLGAAGATTLAAALLGVWAGRRVVRPLTDVGAAARSIARGDLGARLEVGTDPDLAEFAGSFNSMVAALEARIQRDTRFASDVSHELRSPLTTLRSALAVLERRREDMSVRSRQALDLLAEELLRFERLVQDLLELAREESGADLVDLDPVRIGDFIRHSLTTAGHSNGEAAVEVDVTTNEVVLVDKRRLDRVLKNLLENASTHAGGAVRVGAFTYPGGLRIEVDDAGPGVPDSERTRIFGRFHRGHVSGRRGDSHGTGLGLALVAEHVSAMQGTVWVEAAPSGSGARFVVELPRVDL